MEFLTQSCIAQGFKSLWPVEGNKCHGEKLWEPALLPGAALTVEGQGQMPHLCRSWIKFPRSSFPRCHFLHPPQAAGFPLLPSRARTTLVLLLRFGAASPKRAWGGSAPPSAEIRAAPAPPLEFCWSGKAWSVDPTAGNLLLG